jgi:hypothetical protein
LPVRLHVRIAESEVVEPGGVYVVRDEEAATVPGHAYFIVFVAPGTADEARQRILASFEVRRIMREMEPHGGVD